VNARSVLLGAAVVVGVGVPVALIGSLAVDDDSDLVFPLAALVVAAFVAGGWCAARADGAAPLLTGAAAAVAGFAVAQALAVVLLLAQDEDVRPAAIAANAVLAAGAGLLGGALGGQRP
jgi:putative membrane protein (TIGR04086 family)